MAAPVAATVMSMVRHFSHMCWSRLRCLLASAGIGEASPCPSAAGDAVTRAESWLLVLSVLVLAFWLALYRWYSLFVHHATPYFAFEKVPVRFDSPILRATLWLFLGLAFLYLAGYWLIRAAPVLSTVPHEALVPPPQGW